MKILVLGATGMLGNAMMQVLSAAPDLDVFGTVRSEDAKRFFSTDIGHRLLTGIDVTDNDALANVLRKNKPDIVINCIGLIKQLAQADDPVEAITINALLPHRLKALCDHDDRRFIHFSTDCVFNGAAGNYVEAAPSDAVDMYGKSKYLGEVSGQNAVTLRTSIIGHELQGAYSLIGWFLKQEGRCKGFRKAIFSGLPTTSMAEIVRDYVIPNPQLQGLYHVAAQPIAKFDLLRLVAEVYGKEIEIVPDDTLVIDRSLNADRFTEATTYNAPSWRTLIETMHRYYDAVK